MNRFLLGFTSALVVGKCLDSVVKIQTMFKLSCFGIQISEQSFISSQLVVCHDYVLLVSVLENSESLFKQEKSICQRYI